MRERLKQRREQLELKSRYVAKASQISTNYYSEIENGIRRPSLPVALRIAEVVDDDPRLLFADVVEPEHVSNN